MNTFKSIPIVWRWVICFVVGILLAFVLDAVMTRLFGNNNDPTVAFLIGMGCGIVCTQTVLAIAVAKEWID